MGYDMYWVNEDAGQAEAMTEARALMDGARQVLDALPEEGRGKYNAEKAEELGHDAHEAWEGRTPAYARAMDAYNEALGAYYAAQVSYFRLNIFGMGRARHMMGIAGMVYDGNGPDWPDTGDLTWDEIDEIRYPDDSKPGAVSTLTAERRTRAEAYVAKHNAALAQHEETDTPGIPLFKFGSNDGWIVVPAECAAAVRAWHGYVEEEGEDKALAKVGEVFGDTEYWLKWVAWLAAAAKHGGFTVH